MKAVVVVRIIKILFVFLFMGWSGIGAEGGIKGAGIHSDPRDDSTVSQVFGDIERKCQVDVEKLRVFLIGDLIFSVCSGPRVAMEAPVVYVCVYVYKHTGLFAMITTEVPIENKKQVRKDNTI